MGGLVQQQAIAGAYRQYKAEDRYYATLDDVPMAA
jgi:hypothetical protein